MEPNPIDSFPDAPAWGNALGTIGKVSVWIALTGCVLALLLSFTNRTSIRRWCFYFATAAFVSAFSALTMMFVKDQFQFEYVFGHSEKINPIAYKISSVWTAQQGSFMLWALFSSLLGAFAVSRTKHLERAFTGTYALFLGVLAAILVRETPFNLIPDAILKSGVVKMPPDGRGMTPLLQNYWNIIHPPTMFVGFGSLTVPFAYACAAMLVKDYTEWTKLARGATLFGLSVLGLGISMGGLWAYETQGWGGFWAWDPVENVSLVPWLLLVAFSHGLIVQATRRKWQLANLLMGGLPFLTFVYGTFLTRSGLLDGVSNHSFASMERGALQIMRAAMYAFIAIYAILVVIAAKSEPKQEAKQEAPGVNRESFYQLGVLSISLLAFVVALGMSWPVITALRGGQGSAVKEDVYHKAVIWFFIPIMVALGAGPLIGWKREKLGAFASRLVTLLSISVAVTGGLLLIFKNPTYGVGIEPGATVNSPFGSGKLPLVPAMAVLMLLAIFPAVTNLWRAIELAKRSKLGIGSFIAHFGIAVLMGGLLISRGFERKAEFRIQDGRPAMAMDYSIAFKEFDPKRWNDRSNTVKFEVTDPHGKKFEIAPTLYYTMMGEKEQPQVWPYVIPSLTHDLYFAMTPPMFEFFETPLNVKPGETKTASGVTVKFLKPIMFGQPGQPGTKFGAELEVAYDGNTYKVSPTLELAEGGLKPSMTPIGEFICALDSMNAGDRSVNVQLYVNPPLYGIQMFYKPLTSLVWLGTGIFTIGGLMSAFYRRSRNVRQVEGRTESAKISSEDLNAPVPAPES